MVSLRQLATVGKMRTTRVRPRSCSLKLVEWICNDRGYHDAWQAARPPRIAHYVLDPPRMRSRKGALAACALPDIPTPGDLAAWLGITVIELDWFADVRGINPAEGRLAHYRYVWVPKTYGMRLTEVPKIRLRDIQRKILRGILDPFPCTRRRMVSGKVNPVVRTSSRTLAGKWCCASI